MKVLKTVTGSKFQYKVHPDGEIIVYPEQDGALQERSAIVITPYTIKLIREAIQSARSVHMGASRDNPPAHSLGALLKQEGQSPQQLSYLIPLLIAEGYCDCVKDGQAFVVRYRGGQR